MPGFFEGFKRMINGQPVFQPGDDPIGDKYDDDPQKEMDVEDRPQPKRSGRTDGKHVPIVRAESVECRTNGSNMELDVRIQNTSAEPVFLDKILILNTKWELDRELRAGETREFTVYRGPRPTNSHLTKAEIQYRDIGGDYFSAIHYVEYDDLRDGMMVIEELKFLPPVKDI